MWQSLQQLLNYYATHRKDISLYALYFLLSVGIWSVLRLNESTVREISLPLRFIVPQGWALTEAPPARFVFTLRGTRWRTWSQYRSCRNQVANLNLKTEVISSFELNDLLAEARRLTSAQTDVSILSPVAPLRVRLEPAVKRQIPVKVFALVQFKNGFQAIGDLQVHPQMVEVEGASSLLNGLRYLLCDTLKLTQVSDSFSHRVALKQSDARFKLLSTSVRVSQAVDQLTESSVLVPIKLTNAPVGGYTFPNRVSVRYQVPLRHFKRINENSFHVVADARTLQDGSNKLKINAQTTQPELLKMFSCSVQEVNYYIKSDK
jgi:hypothetical protein